MTFLPDTVLQRTTSIVLVLYLGVFLGQSLCALHGSHREFPMEAAMDRPNAPTSFSVATHTLASKEAHASSSFAAPGPSQHGEHSGAAGHDHSDTCAVVACAPGVTATREHGLAPMNRVSSAHVAYLGGTMPPDAEMVLPPPRLG